MKIILIGLPTVGKSSVGKLLADSLGLTFVDTDQLLQEKEGLSCAEIVLQKGVSYFRALEKEVLKLLPQNSINAVGGGAQVNQAMGYIVYLEANPKVLWERIQARGGLATLKEQTFAEFLEMVRSRIPIYESVANYRVNTDNLSLKEVWQVTHSALSLELPLGESRTAKPLVL